MLLIQRGANVKAISNNGQQPLHLAAEGNMLELAKLLIKKGSNPLVRDATGKTAADVAKEYGYDEMAHYLRLQERDTERREGIFEATATPVTARARALRQKGRKEIN